VAFESKAQLLVPEKNCNSSCFVIMVARRIATLCCRARSIVQIRPNKLSRGTQFISESCVSGRTKARRRSHWRFMVVHAGHDINHEAVWPDRLREFLSRQWLGETHGAKGTFWRSAHHALDDGERATALAKRGVAFRNGLAPRGKSRARFRSGPSLPAASRLLGMWLGIRNNSRER
jgi:hypothetical protein